MMRWWSVVTIPGNMYLKKTNLLTPTVVGSDGGMSVSSPNLLVSMISLMGAALFGRCCFCKRQSLMECDVYRLRFLNSCDTMENSSGACD